MSCDKNSASANELFRWEVDSTGGVIIAAFLDDKTSSVDVPAQIDGKPVVGIGDGAFSLRRALTKISLPDGVRKLGSNAFSRLSALTEIALPDGLQTLGFMPFAFCSPDLTLYGAAGSVAEGYARENGIRFEPR